MRREEALATIKAALQGRATDSQAAAIAIDAMEQSGLIKFTEPLANEGTEDITQGLIDLIRADLDSANPAKALGEDLALAGLALVKVRRASDAPPAAIRRFAPRSDPLPVTPDPPKVTPDPLLVTPMPGFQRRVPRYPDRTPAEVLGDVQLGTGAHPEQWLVGRGPNGSDRLIAALTREGFQIVRTPP